jgi:hypothetical protein
MRSRYIMHVAAVLTKPPAAYIKIGSSKAFAVNKTETLTCTFPRPSTKIHTFVHRPLPRPKHPISLSPGAWYGYLRRVEQRIELCPSTVEGEKLDPTSSFQQYYSKTEGGYSEAYLHMPL